MIKYLIGDKDFIVLNKGREHYNLSKITGRKCGLGADAVITPTVSQRADFGIEVISEGLPDVYTSALCAACYARYMREQKGLQLVDYDIDVNGNIISLSADKCDSNIFAYFPPKCKNIFTKTVNLDSAPCKFRVVDIEKPIAIFKCYSIDTVDIKRLCFLLWQTGGDIEKVVFYDKRGGIRFISHTLAKGSMENLFEVSYALAHLFVKSGPISFKNLPNVNFFDWGDGRVFAELSPQKIYEINGIYI